MSSPSVTADVTADDGSDNEAIFVDQPLGNTSGPYVPKRVKDMAARILNDVEANRSTYEDRRAREQRGENRGAKRKAAALRDAQAEQARLDARAARVAREAERERQAEQARLDARAARVAHEAERERQREWQRERQRVALQEQVKDGLRRLQGHTVSDQSVLFLASVVEDCFQMMGQQAQLLREEDLGERVVERSVSLIASASSCCRLLVQHVYLSPSHQQQWLTRGAWQAICGLAGIHDRCETLALSQDSVTSSQVSDFTLSPHLSHYPAHHAETVMPVELTRDETGSLRTFMEDIFAQHYNLLLGVVTSFSAGDMVVDIVARAGASVRDSLQNALLHIVLSGGISKELWTHWRMRVLGPIFAGIGWDNMLLPMDAMMQLYRDETREVREMLTTRVIEGASGGGFTAIKAAVWPDMRRMFQRDLELWDEHDPRRFETDKVHFVNVVHFKADAAKARFSTKSGRPEFTRVFCHLLGWNAPQNSAFHANTPRTLTRGLVCTAVAAVVAAAASCC
eukprot:SAG31_NODE_5680_length_2384_cov_2.122101_1_plen_513_part_00